MKFKITMKDPDGVYESVQQAALDSTFEVKGLSESEREALTESRVESINEVIGQWIEHGEYLTVEFDTEAGTATVCED